MGRSRMQSGGLAGGSRFGQETLDESLLGNRFRTLQKSLDTFATVVEGLEDGLGRRCGRTGTGPGG